MGAIFLTPVYLLVNGYLLWRLFRWMNACSVHTKKRWVRILVFLLFAFVMTAPLTSFLMPEIGLRFYLGSIGRYWLGILIYLLLIIGIMDLAGVVIRRMRWWRKKAYDKRKCLILIGVFAILLTAGISGYGIYHAGDIQVRSERLTIHKNCKLKQLRVVLLADLHLGYNAGLSHTKKVVELVNEQNADLICIAGDIFDNDYDAIRQPEEIAVVLTGMKSRYGAYACYGNHDIYEKILAGFTFSGEEKAEDPRFLDFLQKANIQLLQDEGICIDDAFYLFGRKDPAMAEKMGERRKQPEELLSTADTKMPVIVMDHQPRALDEMAAAGVDMDLSGHTHNGQLAPVNLILPFFWENPDGIIQKDGMYSCVTSGAGVWGPAMRVGTNSEIMVLTVDFT